ncbi:hypothetical protein FACUT_7286 [Fusarium acutatum]|uniref:Ankyrin n=1 Tax=Fusarium acutatum TaxID=78861 RepID=A0A8H4NQQ2_9HYPO|nr:hypothetical protein FACUT_7286 [Fusarium acutatum]
MHFSQLLITAAALFTQGTLAVGIKTYTGRDCTGTEQTLTVDHNAACNPKVQRFQSYKENGFGPGNGQRIAFYAQPSCSQESFIYDTYSNNGDYFHSKQCYNINGHSPVKLRLCRPSHRWFQQGQFWTDLKNETPTLQRVKWARKKEKATELMKQLREVRARISELQLAYGNLSLTRIEIALHDIQIMQRNQYATTQSLSACLLDTRDQLRVDRNATIQSQADIAVALEALKTTTPRLPSAWVETISNQLATTIKDLRPKPAKNDTKTDPAQSSPRQQSFQPASSPLRHTTLEFRLRLVQSQCSNNCVCRCHGSLSSYRPWKALPKALQMIMGSILFEYSSSPVSRVPCDVVSCFKSRLTRFTLRYGFPFWFLKYAVHILVERLSTSCLTFTLAVRRTIPLEVSKDNIFFQISFGNLDAIKRIVFENPTAILDVDYNGNSVLHVSAYGFHPWELSLQIWQVLLQAGADPDQVDEHGFSFRHRIANLLLRNSIPLDLQPQVESLVQTSQCLDGLDLSFIHQIVVKRCPIEIAPVLEVGKAEILVQVNSEDWFGMTPLMYAVSLGDAKAASALIKAGASVHKQGPSGRSLVDYVGRLPPNSCATMLQLLITAGASVAASSPLGWTPLHTAAVHDNVTMMERLLDQGVSPDCLGPRGNRPIHYAAGANSVGVIHLLHEKGADLNPLANNGLSPLGVAIRDNATEAQSALFELGADHLITRDWGTHFHLAAYWGNERTFKTLSQLNLNGLDGDAKDAKGLTATDIYENRYDKTDELTLAFYRLRDSIRLQFSQSCQDEDKFEDTDAFFDAYEFLNNDRAA